MRAYTSVRVWWIPQLVLSLSLLCRVALSQGSSNSNSNSDVSTQNVSYPDPLPGLEHVFLHDPTIIFNEETKEYGAISTGNSLPFWTAPALSGPWKQAGSVLGRGMDIWCADISLEDGTYYVYYAISQFNTRNSRINVATSKTGDANTFTDVATLFNTSDVSKSNAIDPNLIVSSDGKKHLVYGSYFGGIYLMPMLNFTSLNTSLLPGHLLAAGFPDGNAVEGANIYLKDGTYWLFVSSGQRCSFNQHQLPTYGTSEYKLLVGKSDKVEGPYVDKEGKSMLKGGGTVLLSSFDDIFAPGGSNAYFDPKTQRDIMVFHYRNPAEVDLTAKMGIYYLDFSSGWPELVGADKKKKSTSDQQSTASEFGSYKAAQTQTQVGTKETTDAEDQEFARYSQQRSYLAQLSVQWYNDGHGP